MIDKTFRFTKKAIAEIEPLAKIATYHDTIARGLKLVVRPTGRKTFILYRKIAGRPERIQLGAFPDLTIEQARAKASRLNSDIANGENPATLRRDQRGELTFAQLFDLYLERYAKVHKRSWQNDIEVFNRHCQTLATQRLSAVRKVSVQRLHTHIGKNNGIYVANRVLALIQSLFNRANDWGYEYPNPVKGIKRFREHSRDRFLLADELPKLFKSLADEPNGTIRDYVLMSLFTGARKANVMAMRWKEVNFDRACWTIPLTKNGESHVVPLIPPAIEILKIRQMRSKTPWVFPSHSECGHLVEPKKCWARICERAGIENLRLHDLRRSMGSWQAATGASLSVIGKTLAHKNVNSTAIYARLDLDPVRDAMNKAAEAMLAAVGDV